MLIERKDRWKDILTKMEKGSYYGAETRDNKIKGRVFLTFMGRKISAREASLLSGISQSFFREYKNTELPVDDLVGELDKKWMREKTKALRQGLR
jgi:hypothetical protein